MLNKGWLLIIILLSSFGALQAGEPTVAPSNVSVSNITCSSATIKWKSGDGAWDMVIMKEASAVNGFPVDGVGTYTASSTFGSLGSEVPSVGSNNYLVFNNLAGLNSFTVTGLKLNTTYYIAILSHDQGPPVDYLTSSYATKSFTTNNVNLDFTIKYSDTCQNTDKVKFVNTSTVSVSSPTFVWRFYNSPPAFDQDNKDSLIYTFTKPGLKKVELYLVPTGGCSGTITKSVLIYPRTKPGPYVKNNDTTQCYARGVNHFYFDETTTMDATPKGSYQRSWQLPKDTSTIPNPDIKGVKPGKYRILYRGISLYNSIPTGCEDTAYLNIRVVPDPTSGITINDSIQCLKGNVFKFDNVYPGLVSFSWDFGDGGSSLVKKSNHTYSLIGNYSVIHKAASVEGCKSADTTLVLVKRNVDATFATLPASICEAAKPIVLVPLKWGGKFIGQHMKDSLFTPGLPGTFPIKYYLPDTFCPDSTTQSITVKPLPRFTLGRDTNLCNGGSISLTVAAPGSILWDDASTANTRSISTAGKFWATANDAGCVWTDSINLFLGTSPYAKLPFDTLLCRGSVVFLHANWPGSKILWSTGSTDTFIYVSNAGTYTVSVTNPCGTATDDVTINYQGDYCDVFVPDAFTPNHDGRNEVFQILGKGISPIMFRIYNRWGQKVFDSDDAKTFGWDGYYNNQPCMDGLYSYIFYYEVVTGNRKRRNSIRSSVLLYH